jgi:hypothetical protein
MTDMSMKVVRNGKEYLGWQWAGGPNECKHGYAQGIPCPDCDESAAQLEEAENV